MVNQIFSVVVGLALAIGIGGVIVSVLSIVNQNFLATTYAITDNQTVGYQTIQNSSQGLLALASQLPLVGLIGGLMVVLIIIFGLLIPRARGGGEGGF